jgi:hypothetical protein
MLLLPGFAGPAWPEVDPFSLVHEQQVITSAGKRTQSLSETPSSVTILTRERNLFDARNVDPGSGEHLQDQILQDGRAAHLTVHCRPVFRR